MTELEEMTMARYEEMTDKQLIAAVDKENAQIAELTLRLKNGDVWAKRLTQHLKKLESELQATMQEANSSE